MRTIQGYIFVPKIKYSGWQPMMGPYTFAKVTDHTKYQPLEENRLRVFDKLKEAEEAAKFYTEFLSEEHTMRTAYLQLKFADTDQGMEQFLDEDHLIAIGNPNQIHDIGDKGTMFYGPTVKGCKTVHPFPGADICYTNFTIYRKEDNEYGDSPYERALEMAKQSARQGQLPATIGQFKIEFQ